MISLAVTAAPVGAQCQPSVTVDQQVELIKQHIRRMEALGVFVPTPEHQAAILVGLRAALKDPGSAVLGEVHALQAPNSYGIGVCGYINARNSYGGYTGMQPFNGSLKWYPKTNTYNFTPIAIGDGSIGARTLAVKQVCVKLGIWIEVR